MLKPFASSLDAIPESVREFYRADEAGVFRLQVTPESGWELRDTVALQKALSSERSKAQTSTKELEALRKTLGDHDVDDLLSVKEKYQAILDSDPEKQVEQKLAQKRAELEAQFASDRKKLQSGLDEREGVIKSLESTIKGGEIDRALARELGKHFDPEYAELIHAALRRRVDARQVDGRPRGHFEVVVLDESGQPATSRKPGKYAEDMSLEELVESAIESNASWASLRRGSPHKGGGALPGAARPSNGRMTAEELAKLPVAERLRYAYANRK